MRYKFRSNKIILIGDTHSTYQTRDLLNLRIPNGSDVLHVGDGGWGFGDPEYALQNAKSWVDIFHKLCENLDIRLYHLIGNHDNPDVWKFPSTDRVFWVQSGDVGEFPNGKTALFVGGGVSVDRFTRKEGVSYWKEEITPPLDNVEKCDILFSHDCPEYFNHPTKTLPLHYGWYIERDPLLLGDCEKQRTVMGDIVKKSEVKTIFYGHYHNSFRQEVEGIYAQCLDISELFGFDAEKEYKL